MSKYTTEVRFVCEMYAGAEHGDYTDIETIISNSWSQIFNDTWTTYDTDYKGTLCHKILSKYYFNEIGFETVGQWKHMLNQRLCEIMPYYNELYKTLELDYMTFDDVNYTKTHEGSKAGHEDSEMTGTTDYDETAKTVYDSEWSETDTDSRTTAQTTTEDSTKWNYYSDTPQGGISGLSSNTYLTNATKDTADIDGTLNETMSDTLKKTGTKDDATNFTKGADTSEEKEGSSDYTSTDEYLNTYKGKYNQNKSYAQALQEIRDAIINIDQMIMDELSDLFMLLW